MLYMRYLISKEPDDVATVIPSLQMGTPRHRDGKELARGHTAGRAGTPSGVSGTPQPHRTALGALFLSVGMRLLSFKPFKTSLSERRDGNGS